MIVDRNLFKTLILGTMPSTSIKTSKSADSHLTFRAYKNAKPAPEFALLSLPSNSVLCIQEDQTLSCNKTSFALSLLPSKHFCSIKSFDEAKFRESGENTQGNESKKSSSTSHTPSWFLDRD